MGRRDRGAWLTIRMGAAAVAVLGLAACQTPEVAERFIQQITAPAQNASLPIALDPAPRPTLRTGDTFFYEGGRVRRVSVVAGQEITWSNLDRELYRTSADFFVPRLYQERETRIVSRTIVGDPTALWPLETGKSVEFTVDTATRMKGERDQSYSRRYWRCTVPGAYEVETPGGAFEAFRVECESFRRRWGARVLRIEWDYAPSIGHFVMRDWRNLRTGRRFVYRLEAALPSEVATKSRIEAVRARLGSGS